VSASLRLRLGLVLMRLCIVLALAIGLFAAGKEAMKPWLFVGGFLIVTSWIVTIWMSRTASTGARAHG
jgi:hypothetical protein